MSRQPVRWGVFPLLGFVCLLPASSFGQMVSAGFPLVGARDSFFENIGINSGFGGGFTSPFNRFSANTAPRFGGFTPGAGLTGGFGINTGHFGAHLGFNFSQGASRSVVSSAPVVTGMNGFPMFFQNSVQRPFVTGLVPNLGGGLIFPNLGAANTIPGFAMQNGKVLPPAGLKPKTKPALAKPIQVANHKPLVDAVPPTRAEREAQAKAEETADRLAIQKYLRKGREAEAEGKRGVAKLYYQMAARRAEGHLKNEALASLDRVQH